MALKLESPTQLEDRIVRMLLAGSLAALGALRRQWDAARIAERRVDVWGTTTLRLWLPIDTPLVTPFRQDYADVVLRPSGTASWRAVILEIEHGLLHEILLPACVAAATRQGTDLEMSYSMLVPSPDDPDESELVPVPDRDWAELRDYFGRIGARS